MELPKNITQIGESDHNCKIYVEDYVISYIKQLNQPAGDKEMAVALYGVRKEENDVSYLFFYGACKLDFLSREVRHLSQAQSQEIEKLRKRYFPDYQFLGYRVLNGEMVEGFHVCEQGICRYINGYACFYEKNDQMLAYMLDTRKEEAAPEEVDQEKYERVRKRQEERRAQNVTQCRGRTGRCRQEEEELQEQTDEESVMGTSRAAERAGRVSERTAARGTKRTSRSQERENTRASGKNAGAASGKTVKVMRASVVGVFVLLCIAGLTTLNGYGKLEKLQVAAKQLVAEFTEKKIPDANGAVAAMSSSGQSDTLVAEDKLTDAIQKENAGQQGAGIPVSDPQAAQETQSQGTPGASDETAGQDQTGQGQSGGEWQLGSQGQSGQGNQAAQGQTSDQGASGGQGQTAGQGAAGGQGQSAGQGTTSGQGASGGQGAAGGQGTASGQGASGGQGQIAGQGTASGQGASAGQQTGQPGQDQQTGDPGGQTTQPPETAGQSGGSAAQSQPGESSQSQPEAQQPSQQASAPVGYVIQKGDTLTAISLRQYGTDKRVKDICELNGITNPDDIRFGQKILLP